MTRSIPLMALLLGLSMASPVLAFNIPLDVPTPTWPETGGDAVTRGCIDPAQPAPKGTCAEPSAP
ncbi:hypothetical protein E7811_07585 [Aliigemmobacter aestuarii]|uniref:Uncharacterized protein n=1 Tax=Aliigemmobacter aestuarii TaxID=1445661 RepID=A0A4S3MTN7_9RHOB|nr:hypothetical protein [Gemmobacter aestuarii]THD85544.1 hypothetical protein E7811_07585 [Gemmobacter aestuarii]